MRNVKITILIFFVLCPAFCLGQVAEPSSIYAWGLNDEGQCDVPAPNTGFIDIAAGSSHSLGLKADGSIVAWGSNGSGRCNIPAPNAGFIDIAAGGFHSLGLKTDGSIVAWGSNGSGQCNIPAPNAGFIAIAAGWVHSLGIKADGSIVAWGSNGWRQCNVPAPNNGFIAIAAGIFYHSLGLKADGSIVAWGRNGSGQCNIPAPNSGFIAIAAGGSHSLGLKDDGSIVAWGAGQAGQTGDVHFGQCNVPPPNTGFIAIAAGDCHSLGLKADGSIVAWGGNYYGQCNVPVSKTGFVAITSGEEHCLAIKATPSSAFAYQGMLIDESIPLYGIYDFEFDLYDEPVDGILLELPVTIEDLDVIDGHYTTELDFGSDIFNGEPRWLEIWTRSGDSTGDFITLGPRQKISSVPYAIYAHTAGSLDGEGNGIGSRNSLDAADGDPTDAVYVDNDGNVGIGTTSPAEKLHVSGDIRLNSGGKITFADDKTRIRESYDGLYLEAYNDLYLEADDDLDIWAKYEIRLDDSTLVIDSSSHRVGIGTRNPSAKLEVQEGAIKATGGLIIETRTSDPSNPATGQIWLRTDID